MTDRGATSWTESRALIRRGTKFLIVRAGAGQPEPTEPWHFPGGRLAGRESPEAALRRICRDSFGVELVLHVGQPPFVHHFGTHSITYRYYESSIASGEPSAPAGAELRWVERGQLRDYVFDAATQPVVDWLLEESPGP